MKVALIGLGVQGAKRRHVAGHDVVALVDPIASDATHRDIRDVPMSLYDAALVCVPDDAKLELVSLLLSNRKHVLVEKPFLALSSGHLRALAEVAKARGVACYTAYNHRFEPHIERLRKILTSGELGKIYSIRLFYGNGTARNVRESSWRDRGSGVLRDLGSHLVDLTLFLLDRKDIGFELVSARRVENRAYDHALLVHVGEPLIQLEVTFLSWRNQFSCEVLGANGSVHIDSLCKWGATTFTHRKRVLPSGRPLEESVVIEEPDPTWALEYEHFKAAIEARSNTLEKDIWINDIINRLSASAKS